MTHLIWYSMSAWISSNLCSLFLKFKETFQLFYELNDCLRGESSEGAVDSHIHQFLLTATQTTSLSSCGQEVIHKAVIFGADRLSICCCALFESFGEDFLKLFTLSLDFWQLISNWVELRFDFSQRSLNHTFDGRNGRRRTFLKPQIGGGVPLQLRVRVVWPQTRVLFEIVTNLLIVCRIGG